MAVVSSRVNALKLSIKATILFSYYFFRILLFLVKLISFTTFSVKADLGLFIDNIKFEISNRLLKYKKKFSIRSFTAIIAFTCFKALL